MSEQGQDHVAPQWLRAGPVTAKFEDGQLRYLRVGDKEIIRRIYFAVRDGNWNTALPKFTTAKVESAADHFSIELSARCRLGTVDYGWTGQITGSADGTIKFRAEGAANSNFESNRIGLCVLYGNQSLFDQEFQTDGTPAKGVFPRLVNPKLVAEQFRTLRYSAANGLNVTCAVEGATFDMEDQRNWGDSSWKAYAPLPYGYKNIEKGDRKIQTVTLTVGGHIDANATSQQPIRVKLGQPIDGVRIPKLSGPTSIKPAVEFQPMNYDRPLYSARKLIEFSYIPTTHLPDDDTIMENVPAVMDQAKTAHAFARSCQVRVGPIHIPGAASNEPVAAAWTAAIVKSLAEGEVSEAAFDMGTGPGSQIVQALHAIEGRQLVSLQTEPADPHDLYSFAVSTGQTTVIFLINRTKDTCAVALDTGSVARVKVWGFKVQETDQAGGEMKFELKPFEVLRITIPN